MTGVQTCALPISDVAQISTFTVGTGSAAVATAGDIYSVTVTLAEGAAIEYEFTAVGGETEQQISNKLVTGLNGLADTIDPEFSVANGGGTTTTITITDLEADDGGFTVTATASGGISGTSASNLAGIADWATVHADVITDFVSGDDVIDLGIAQGANSNYNEGATETSYADAYAAAQLALGAGVVYYLTSIDGSGGETATGLLFFDANSEIGRAHV